MRISDWSSDVCSSDLHAGLAGTGTSEDQIVARRRGNGLALGIVEPVEQVGNIHRRILRERPRQLPRRRRQAKHAPLSGCTPAIAQACSQRSEEHTSELQSLMRISYAVFCLKKKK